MNSIQMDKFVLTFEYGDVQQAAQALVRQYKKLLANNDRVGRAIGYVRNGSMEWVAPKLYIAHSEHSDACYQVNLLAEKQIERCTCPDNQKGNLCKHRIAAQLIEMMHNK